MGSGVLGGLPVQLEALNLQVYIQIYFICIKVTTEITPVDEPPMPGFSKASILLFVSLLKFSTSNDDNLSFF